LNGRPNGRLKSRLNAWFDGGLKERVGRLLLKRLQARQSRPRRHPAAQGRPPRLLALLDNAFKFSAGGLIR
jgi:hypothetical protein